MLFKVNVHRLGKERRIKARQRIRQLAFASVVIGMNVVLVGMFVVAVMVQSRNVAVARERLEATERALAKVVIDEGGAASEEEVRLIRERAKQTRWSRVLAAVAVETPADMWFPRIRLAERRGGSGSGSYGLRLTGRIKAGGEEEGLTNLMSFLAAIREDQSFREHFSEARLVDSAWLTDSGEEYLEFEIFCPLSDPDIIIERRSAGTVAPDDYVTPDEAEDLEPAGADTTSVPELEGGSFAS
ncbi:MAG: hypothetical protein GF405_08110 [Candidatus Eisenbacteria bacterium]|nr:hypothetical protein [Candidatus Eisenbacteria bacterium]